MHANREIPAGKWKMSGWKKALDGKKKGERGVANAYESVEIKKTKGRFPIIAD